MLQKKLGILGEYMVMLTTPRLLVRYTRHSVYSLRPGSWRTSIGLGSMAQCSAHILICLTQAHTLRLQSCRCAVPLLVIQLFISRCSIIIQNFLGPFYMRYNFRTGVRCYMLRCVMSDAITRLWRLVKLSLNLLHWWIATPHGYTFI